MGCLGNGNIEDDVPNWIYCFRVNMGLESLVIVYELNKLTRISRHSWTVQVMRSYWVAGAVLVLCTKISRLNDIQLVKCTQQL